MLHQSETFPACDPPGAAAAAFTAFTATLLYHAVQVSWDDVGGLAEVKQRLQEAVLWPQQHADALQRLGATAPKGVLLYGPPGCSKTLLARAVAATAGLNFLSVKGGELYSSYVGESERAVAALFARARSAAPAVVFFDELDGLVSARGDAGAGAGIGERVLAQLLTELDGLQVRRGMMQVGWGSLHCIVEGIMHVACHFDDAMLAWSLLTWCGVVTLDVVWCGSCACWPLSRDSVT